MALKLLKFGINIVSIEPLLLISLKPLSCLVFAQNRSKLLKMQLLIKSVGYMHYIMRSEFCDNRQNFMTISKKLVAQAGNERFAHIVT